MKISHIISYTAYFYFTFPLKFPITPLLRNKTRASDGRPSPPNVVPQNVPLTGFLNSSPSLSLEPHNFFSHFFLISFLCVLSICSPSFLGSGHLGVTVHRDCAQVLSRSGLSHLHRYSSFTNNLINYCQPSVCLFQSPNTSL